MSCPRTYSTVYVADDILYVRAGDVLVGQRIPDKSAQLLGAKDSLRLVGTSECCLRLAQLPEYTLVTLHASVDDPCGYAQLRFHGLQALEVWKMLTGYYSCTHAHCQDSPEHSGRAAL